MLIEESTDVFNQSKSNRLMIEHFRANIVKGKVMAKKLEIEDVNMTSERYREMMNRTGCHEQKDLTQSTAPYY